MTCRSNAIFRPMEDRDRPAVLALSKACCWVAEVDGRVAGYAAGQMETAGRDSSIQRAGDQWFELEELYVDRTLRDGGLGGALLDHVEQALRGEGVKRLMLTGANRAQEPLLRFYLRRGMTLYSFRAFRDL